MEASKYKDVDFIITLSGPFRNGAEIMKEQAHTLKRWKTSDSMTEQEVIENGERFVDFLVSYSKNGLGKEGIQQILSDLINYQISKLKPEKMEENLKVYKTKENMFNENFNEVYAFYTSDHQKSFMTFDASIDFKEIVCPVLIMFGEQDKNVVVSSNLPPVLNGLMSSKITDFTFRIIPGADHGYTNKEYFKKAEMIPGTLDYMSKWILSRTNIN